MRRFLTSATICPHLGAEFASTAVLTFKFQDRDFRLTDVSGRVIDKLLA